MDYRTLTIQQGTCGSKDEKLFLQVKTIIMTTCKETQKLQLHMLPWALYRQQIQKIADLQGPGKSSENLYLIDFFPSV